MSFLEDMEIDEDDLKKDISFNLKQKFPSLSDERNKELTNLAVEKIKLDGPLTSTYFAFAELGIHYGSRIYIEDFKERNY